MIWLPVAMLGCLVTLLTISLVNALNMKYLPDWVIWALNLVPAFGVGVWGYGSFARRQTRREAATAPTTGHLGRAAPLYVISGLLGAVIAANYRDPGFGLVAQLVVWPLMVTLGGILGDRLAGMRSS
jgi:hypothetical protein